MKRELRIVEGVCPHVLPGGDRQERRNDGPDKRSQCFCSQTRPGTTGKWSPREPSHDDRQVHAETPGPPEESSAQILSLGGDDVVTRPTLVSPVRTGRVDDHARSGRGARLADEHRAERSPPRVRFLSDDHVRLQWCDGPRRRIDGIVDRVAGDDGHRDGHPVTERPSDERHE